MAKITNRSGALWLPAIKVGEKVEQGPFVGRNETAEVSDGYAAALAKHHAYVERFARRELVSDIAVSGEKKPDKGEKPGADKGESKKS